MNDIVYVFRPGPRDSLALRFSLRSLVNFPHRKVWLVGDPPRWLSRVNVIPAKDIVRGKTGKDKHINVWYKINKACHQENITEDFYLFNDDFIILKSVTDFPYYNRGKLAPTEDTSSYTHMMNITASLFENPLNFEVHCPIMYNKEMFKALAFVYNTQEPLLHRSLYGNHYKIESTQIADNKVYNLDHLKRCLASDASFVSLNNPIEGHRVLKRILTEMFPEKSVFEND